MLSICSEVPFFYLQQIFQHRFPIRILLRTEEQLFSLEWVKVIIDQIVDDNKFFALTDNEIGSCFQPQMFFYPNSFLSITEGIDV